MASTVSSSAPVTPDTPTVAGTCAPAPVEAVRRPLRLTASPFAVLAAVRGLGHAFALTGRWAGGGALVGAAPVRVLPASEDPFAALDRLPPVRGGPVDAVGGGWFGYLGYGLGARVEALPPRPPRPAPLPEFHLAFHDHVLRQDGGGRWWLEGLAPLGDGRADFERRAGRTLELVSTVAEPAPPAAAAGREFHVVAPGRAGHRWAVAEAVERIAAGDLFQVNLGLRLEARAAVDPVDLYLRAARALAPAYGAVFTTDWGGVASLSPELFLRRHGRTVTSGPIKGTVARAAGARAEAQRERLLSSAKDGAEHVMIVDLMRNDLGRVCEYGSVTREERRRIEPHPGVWHLVSDVSGTLRSDCGDADLLRATFPPGSVTGAPKVQSLQLISQLEGTGRELYTGALGYASPLAGLELSVAIRSFELTRDRIWLGAGGGIVADSRPDAELAEALDKAAPLVAAAGGRIAPERDRQTCRAPARLATVAARPDPASGVFETVAMSGGRLAHLDAHLARLAASVRALYGLELPPELAEAARAEALTAAAPEQARLRILAVPRAAGLEVGYELLPVPARPSVVDMWPVVVPGGLGAHKWRDRRLVDELTERAQGAVPLLVDSSGEVLEAAWANVWLLADGVHRTPSADGRILPGVTRARRLEALARADEETRVGPLALDDLRRGELYLTSALADRQPARLRAPAAARR